MWTHVYPEFMSSKANIYLFACRSKFLLNTVLYILQNPAIPLKADSCVLRGVWLFAGYTLVLARTWKVKRG